MYHDINQNWLDDAVSSGNFNVLFSLLNQAIKNHTAMSVTVKKKLLRRQKRVQNILIEEVRIATFGEIEGE